MQNNQSRHKEAQTKEKFNQKQDTLFSLYNCATKM